MILRENVSNRYGFRGLAAAALVAVLGLPTWSAAQDEAQKPDDGKAVVTETVTANVRIVEGKPVEEVRTVTILRDGTRGETISIAGKDDEKKSQDGEKKEKADKDDEKPKKDNAELKAEIAKAKAELDAAQKEFAESTKEVREAMRKAQEELQARMAGSQKLMAEKARALAEVQRKLSTVEGKRLKFEMPKESRDVLRELHISGTKPATITVKPNFSFTAPAQTKPTVTARAYKVEMKAKDEPNVEARLDALEKKFDQILDELKSLRKSGGN